MVFREEIIGNSRLILGDCLKVMKDLPDNSCDSIVTDPPYALEFMGKQWDKFDSYDAGFAYYLSGFIDGEGCFRVQQHQRGTATCAFQLKLRRDDEAILHSAQRFLGIGTLLSAKF
jgi:hypothetical protein